MGYNMEIKAQNKQTKTVFIFQVASDQYFITAQETKLEHISQLIRRRGGE